MKHLLSSNTPLTAGDIVNIAATIEQRKIPADAPCSVAVGEEGWEVAFLLTEVNA